MNAGAIWTSISDLHPHQNLRWRLLGVGDVDYPVAILVENARIEKFVFGIVSSACRISRDKVVIRELALWVVVAHLQPRMRRCGI
ncbi:unannotated protein [freshwater metagenome]|uniref:Unannotated protein n=1 Tax=freshwater metagenome TaxID=449393 RepID=A0A6J7IVR3_9ZZZZ